MSRRRTPREKTKHLAQTRVDILWEQARRDAQLGRSELAKEKMLSARLIAQRARSKLPFHINRRICKECGTILISGSTCRVRVRNNRSKHVVVSCTTCGKVKRYYI